MRRLLTLLGVSVGLLLAPAAGRADDLTLTLKDHRFTPTEIKVPANKRVTITVVNDDATPEEFESKVLKVEKVIPGKSKGVVRIGPLKAGRYPFVGEFHEDTAKGTVIVLYRATATQSFQTGIDIHQHAGHAHESLIIGGTVAGGDGIDDIGLLLEALPGFAHAEHCERVSHLTQ